MGTIHYLDQTASTQDALHGLAADGAPTGTAVLAAEQTTGRGSRGRRWQSPRGGLWLSVLLRPSGPVGFEVLSLRVGLAVADVLAGIRSLPPVALKWPNDLMLHDRKLGGILCEARWQGESLGWVAVGLGINVTNAVPVDTTRLATRLADYGVETTARELAERIAHAIAGLGDRDTRLDPDELAAFTARDWLRGRELRAPLTGWAAGIDEDGALVVRRPDGAEERVRSGSVVLADEG